MCLRLTDSETVLVIEATKRGFIDAMIELFRDGGKADRFGAEALKYGARYSPPVVCEQWEELFDVR